MKYPFLLFCTLFVLVTPVIGMMLDWGNDEKTFFALVTASGMMANGWTLYILWQRIRNIILIRFYLIMVLLSLFWITLYHFQADTTHNPYSSYGIPYGIYAHRFYWVWLIPALATFLLYPAIKLVDQKIEGVKLFYKPETNATRKKIVFLFLLFNILYLIGNVNIEIPVLSYFGRVGHNTTIIFLFWIGYWNRRLGILFYLVLATVLTIMAFELLSGGRYGPMLKGLLLFLGFFVQAGKSLKFKLGLVAVILFPFVVAFAGFLDKVRQVVGRGDLEDVSVERIEEIAGSLDKVERLKRIGGIKQSAFEAGTARNVNWVDVAVITATGNKIDYRGWQNLQTELSHIISLALFSPGGSTRASIEKARLDRLDMGLGTGPARNYGFTVNLRTSVEWGLMADGYSRGGPLVYLLYLIIFWIVLIICEGSIRILNWNQAEQKFLICVFLSILIKSNAVPLYELIREIIINTAFYVPIIFLLRIFTFNKASGTSDRATSLHTAKI